MYKAQQSTWILFSCAEYPQAKKVDELLTHPLKRSIIRMTRLIIYHAIDCQSSCNQWLRIHATEENIQLIYMMPASSGKTCPQS